MKITCSKCGAFLELNRIFVQRYCLPCHNAWYRANRPKDHELSPVELKKKKCRTSSGVLVRRGKLTPQPCEKCGDKKVEKHHEDYDKPELVTWLCRKCHLELHQQRKLEEDSEELGAQRK